MLLRLHEACRYDIDETPALARAAGLTDQEAEEQRTSWEELEELLAKEELARDPRRLSANRRDVAFGLPEDDDILALLRLMLYQPSSRTQYYGWSAASRTSRLLRRGRPGPQRNGSAFAFSTSCNAGRWRSPTRASSGSTRPRRCATTRLCSSL